jgi:hypothetical protein
MIRSFMIYTPNQILFAWSNQEGLDGRDMWHVRERGEIHEWFLWGHLKEKELYENQDVDARIILKFSFKKCYGSVDWIDVVRTRVKWLAVVYSVMNLRVSLFADNFLTGRIIISRNALLHTVSQVVANF